VLAAGAAAAALTTTAPAQAVSPITVRSVAISGGNAISVAGTTIRDVITFTGSGGTITVTSVTSTPVTALAGCSQTSATKATCSGVVRIEAFGGSGNDEIRNKTAVKMGVNGQSDDDLLVGGSNADTLNGGFGQDIASGGSGRDTCSAETTISCEEVTS
jgi:Ca2+-binding RTX toxin-like protein